MTTITSTISLVLIFLAQLLDMVRAQETAAPICYGGGSIATAVILTFIFTILLVAVAFYLWRRKQRSKADTHLILESDPEQGGKGEYAFDNPGFKDTTLIASEKSSKLENNSKAKWTYWAPLSGLHLKSSEKKRAMDDSNIENQVKVVALKSQDFTGLGFNICGNMREGIYIKDILHRGPAFESGKLNPGDRINSVTISFEHMVYEDALNILSYASPYEVILEAKSGKIMSFTQGQGQSPVHPVYRSSSFFDLYHTEKSSKKKLFGDDYSSGSNYSSLQKSRSNMTTLERKESKSPRPNQPKPRKVDKSPHKMTPEMLKTQLEMKISSEDLRLKERMNRIESDLQKADNKGHKFGVRVLPVDSQEKSPKIIEQNQNNYNIERNMEEILPRTGIDEVDTEKPQPPQARKREKKSPEPAFQRNDSGIRRDKDGIPLEIPEHMLGAAVAARRNRKSAVENGIATDEDTNIKTKAKAPQPPGEIKLNFGLESGKTRGFEDLSGLGTSDSSPMEINLRYGSDSEEEMDRTMSSVNTIELNASDITIHQTEEQEGKARKTASTGDLSKIKKNPRSNTGTLERAQSLDITDTSTPSLVMTRTYDATENLLIDKEPRLSLILDSLNTFQRNRLKKSTEWGHLEDVILNFRNDEDWEERRKSEPQFNAVMDRVIQIKRESEEIEILPEDIVRQYQNDTLQPPPVPSIKNKIWPDEEEIAVVKFENSGWKRLEKSSLKDLNGKTDEFARRQQVPVIPERTFNGKVKTTGPDSPKNNFQEKHELENGEKSTGHQIKSEFHVIEKEETSKRTSPMTNPLLNLSNSPNTNILVEYECIKPVPPKRERTPEKEAVIDLCNKIPITFFEKHGITETCSQLAKGRNPDCEMIKDEWEIDTLNTTSPPASMTLVEEVMDSYNKNHNNEVTVIAANPGPSSIQSNIPDESKTLENLKNITENFIMNEKSVYESNTNIPDDVKVSRHTFETMEIRKPILNFDVPKVEDKLVSHVTVENGASNLHSLELSINNEPNELYTTALDSTIPQDGITNEVTVIVSRPDKITVRKMETSTSDPIVEITENTFSKFTSEIPVNVSESKHITVKEGDHDDYKVEITENKYSTFEVDKPLLQILNKEFHLQNPLIEPPPIPPANDTTIFKSIDDESPVISLTEIKPLEDENLEEPNEISTDSTKTYITEIQVHTPTGDTASEIKITPQNEDHLDSAFETYVKNFESRLDNFEDNMEHFEENLEEFIKNEPKSIILEEKSDLERQASKIQEIAEEQLKTLPEMRFTTSSYETDRKTPEKRHSFELLRSNFEKASADKNPPRRDSTTPPKSRIPISTTMKTPPMSPERRDSRNLENENDKAILELMSSSSIHSTPFTSKIKPPSVSSKNISVTSIRNSSKIPSGLTTLTSKPPIVPRKSDDGMSNNGVESSFKQWVFNSNSNVSNVTVGKDK